MDRCCLQRELSGGRGPTVLIWLSPVSVGIAGGAGVIYGHAANSIRHSGEAEGCMDGLDAMHLPLPQPGAHGGTAVGGGSATKGPCVCLSLVSSDAGILMLCVKDSDVHRVRLSWDSGLGGRPEDLSWPQWGRRLAAGYLLHASGQQRHLPRDADLERRSQEAFGDAACAAGLPRGTARVKTCSHGAAAYENVPQVHWVGPHTQTRPGLLQNTALSWGISQRRSPQMADVSVTASSGTDSPCGC